MKKSMIFGAVAVLGTVFTAAAVSESGPGAAAARGGAAREAAVQGRDAGEPWHVEFEAEMRRDIGALTGFVARELAPAMARQKEGAQAAQAVARFDAVLRGCAGTPGLADYAWALNHSLAQALPLFTALEAMSERDAFVVDDNAGAARGGADALLQAFEHHYRRAARWLDDINMAFGAAYPAAVERIEAQRERDGRDRPLHENAEADIYINGYPFAGIAPLRDPAAVFAPYGVQARPRPRGFVPTCGR